MADATFYYTGTKCVSLQSKQKMNLTPYVIQIILLTSNASFVLEFVNIPFFESRNGTERSPHKPPPR